MRLFCGGDEKTESTASHVSSTGALYVACVGLQRGCVPQRAIRSANNSRHSRDYKWSLRLANIAPSAVDCNTVFIHVMRDHAHCTHTDARRLCAVPTVPGMMDFIGRKVGK